VSPRDRLLDLVQRYIAVCRVSPGVDTTPCVECLRAAPAGAVPGRRRMVDLAEAFVRAYFAGDADGLPRRLAAHLAAWFDTPAYPLGAVTRLAAGRTP